MLFLPIPPFYAGRMGAALLGGVLLRGGDVRGSGGATCWGQHRYCAVLH